MANPRIYQPALFELQVRALYQRRMHVQPISARKEFNAPTICRQQEMVVVGNSLVSYEEPTLS